MGITDLRVPKNQNSDPITTHFYCGNHSEVLKLLGTAPLSKNAKAEHWALQIGALVFAGQNIEAQTLFELAQTKKKFLDTESLAQSRFFIGIGLVRTSRYIEACRIFARNLSDYKKSHREKKVNSGQAFYAFQGAAFFRFFHGRFKTSKRLAKKAYRFAYEKNFYFGQAFSAELMGHCNCHLGEVQKGLSDFEKAIQYAEKLGNGGLVSAFQLAREKFKAQYGVDLKNSEKNLSKALKNLNTEDTYSRSEVFLELARQLVLRGKNSAAKKLLDDNADSIYKHQNRRQSATFNLRYAHILHLQGESKAALALLRSSRGNLVKSVDRFYLRQLCGLEEKITHDIYTLHNSKKTPRNYQNFVDERIYARSNPNYKMNIRSSEDFLGDAIDGAFRKSIGPLDLKKNGLLGLIPRVLNQSSSSAFIFIGPARGEIILHCKGDVVWVKKGVTQPMLELLRCLEGGHSLTKEALVKKVWGYEYRPDRHDNLLQATIGKLRKLLRPFSEWIEWNSGSYKLKEDLKILESNSKDLLTQSNTSSATSTKPDPEPQLMTPFSSELNHRQIQLLRKLKAGTFIGVHDYSKQFKVCKMTACRDLTSLWKKKILKKYGRARATQYSIEGTSI